MSNKTVKHFKHKNKNNLQTIFTNHAHEIRLIWLPSQLQLEKT